MTEVLVVLMQNDIAGHLSRQSDGQLLFVYTDAYRSLSSTTPLSVSIPLETKSYEGPILSPWLSNLLPDSEAVLRRWARTFQVSASSPFSLLSTPVGEDCAGAVRFVRPDRLEAALNTTGDVAWLDEKDLAARLRDLRADATAWLGVDTTAQFSLAGAQAKTAFLQRDGRWGVPAGGVATSHIFKPAITGLDGTTSMSTFA
jgi:serine/threonine-protein kinase HipA